MMRSRCLLAALLAGLMVVPAMAQQDDPPPQREGERQEGRRERPERRRMRPRGPDAQLSKFSEELDLDERQRTEIGELLKAHDAKIRELRQAVRPTPEDMEEMRATREEMREAREAGDQARETEIRARIAEMRRARMERMEPIRTSIAAAEKKLHDDILAKLNDDQKESFESVWGDVMDPRRGGREPRIDPRQLHKAVMGLEGLTDTQRRDAEKLFEEFRTAERERPRRGRDVEDKDDDSGEPKAHRPVRGPRGRGARGANPAVKKLYDDVTALLTDEQKAELEKKMSRSRRPRGGPDGGPRRGRTPPDERPDAGGDDE